MEQEKAEMQASHTATLTQVQELQTTVEQLRQQLQTSQLELQHIRSGILLYYTAHAVEPP